jgi:phosphohistidine phosphatase
MRRLIVMRHAKTERRAESGEDFDRALTVEGRRDAGDTARALAAAGLLADLALVSSAVRTRQTFEALQPLLPDMRLEARADLYQASAEALWEAADGAAADTVLLVGHNPSVHALALSLAERSVAAGVREREALDHGYPTATAAAFEFAGDRVACLGVFGPRV